MTGVKPAQRRGLGRWAAILAVVFGLLGTTAAPAAAADVWWWEYRSGDVCAYHHSVTDKNVNGGSYRAEVQAWTRNYTVMPPFWDCKFPKAFPAGYLTTDLYVWKWDGVEWLVCAGFDFRYNEHSSWSFLLYYEPGYSPCGSGYYGTDTFAYVYHNGEWKGGGPLWSGYEWIA